MSEHGTLAEFMKGRTPGPFTPGAVHYRPFGDFIETYWSNADCFCEQVSPFLTICRDMATNEVVGVKVYGVRAKVEEEVAADAARLAAQRERLQEMMREDVEAFKRIVKGG